MFNFLGSLNFSKLLLVMNIKRLIGKIIRDREAGVSTVLDNEPLKNFVSNIRVNMVISSLRNYAIRV